MLGKLLLSALALSGVAGITLGAIGLGGSDPMIDSQRPDCPGKIVCPISGELVCKDQCPLIDVNRDDCPGKIECPLTGELVCKDRCPLDDNTVSVTESKAGESSSTCDASSRCDNRN